MVGNEIRIAFMQWRVLAGHSLFTVMLTCCAQTACAEDRAEESPPWRYRDYLLYSAPPTFTISNQASDMRQINVGDFLQRRNIYTGDVARNLLLSAGFDTRAEWESIRYGLGVFANLPESGQFHFNLYVRPNALRSGFRWQLQPTGLPIAADGGHQNWSVGGFVDYCRSGYEGQGARIGVAPQLILNLSPMLHLPGDAQASVQYAYWRSALDPDTPQNRAMQMALRWRF